MRNLKISLVLILCGFNLSIVAQINTITVVGKTELIENGNIILFDSFSNQDTLYKGKIENYQFQFQVNYDSTQEENIGILTLTNDNGNNEYQGIVVLKGDSLFVKQHKNGAFHFSGSDEQSAFQSFTDSVSFFIEKLDYYSSNEQEDSLKITENNFQYFRKNYFYRNKTQLLAYFFMLNSTNILALEPSFLDTLCVSSKKYIPDYQLSKDICLLSSPSPYTVSFNHTKNILKADVSNTITGKVINSATKDPLPYCNIGINYTTFGTISDEKGIFTIKIDEKYIEDSLIFSSIGFDSKKIAVKELKKHTSGLSLLIELKEANYTLNEFTIKSKKLTYKNGGIKKASILPSGVFYSSGEDGNGAQVANLIVPDTLPVLLVNAAAHINFSPLNYPFRVRVYAQDSVTGGVGEELLHQNVIIKTTQKNGWLSVDLTPYNLVINSNFFIAFEWLELPYNNENIPFISTKQSENMVITWSKQTSFSLWQKAPQNYVIKVKYAY